MTPAGDQSFPNTVRGGVQFSSISIIDSDRNDSERSTNTRVEVLSKEYYDAIPVGLYNYTFSALESTAAPQGGDIPAAFLAHWHHNV